MEMKNGHQGEGKEEENRNQEFFEDQAMEQKENSQRKKQTGREAGIGTDGELSSAAAGRWLIWAGFSLFVCMAAVFGFSAVVSGKDKKAAAVMEIDSGCLMKMTLNRKGKFLLAEDTGDAGIEERLKDASMKEGMEIIFSFLAENGYMGENGGVLISVSSLSGENGTEIRRFAERVRVQAGNTLREKQLHAAIYVMVPEGTENEKRLTEQYGISSAKAALIRDLVEKNTRLQTKDEARLAALHTPDLVTEARKEQYRTSYEAITVERVYGLKQPETAPEEKTAEKETEKKENVEETAETALARETTAPKPKKTAGAVVEELAEDTEQAAGDHEENVSGEAPEETKPEETELESTEEETLEQESVPISEPVPVSETMPTSESIQAESASVPETVPNPRRPHQAGPGITTEAVQTEPVPEPTQPAETQPAPETVPAETSEQTEAVPGSVGYLTPETSDSRLYEVHSIDKGASRGPGE